ncbi:3781_t:CDS:2 [Paraglomus occultum]|uniref:3781_t:CDS:1 n=1 Tax=Paraglomus occultum TaxID=144539 RepID=A0A9N9BEP5_9GLOM|nr:3781_t:CDS:2 [Paraglomus occultum]
MALSATETPSVAEINLRRLLSVCEKQAAEEGLIRGSNKLKFVTNIKHLVRLLDQVEKEETNLDRTAVSEYSRKIRRLNDICDEFKLISPINRSDSQARLVNHAKQSQSEKNKENELELKMVRQAERELKDELLQSRRTRGLDIDVDNSQSLQEKRMDLFSSAISNRRKNSQGTSDESTSTQSVLQHHRQIQSELTDDLVSLAERLKMNSLAFGDILARDEKVIDDAQATVNGNLDRLRNEGGRLRQYTVQSKKTTCFVWVVVIFVCVVFVLMFMLIRVFPKYG